MHAKVIETWSYHNGRRAVTKHLATDVDQVEAIVRQLDRQRNPILFLWPSEDRASHMLDEFSERLEVLGGDGLFWVAGAFSGFFQRRLLNRLGGNEEVEIYGFEIEQGFGAAEKHVCRDVEVVVRAARYYAQFGLFDPSLVWE